METQSNTATAKYPKASDYFKRLLISVPAGLFAFPVYAAQQYDVVIRSGTMEPIVGIPTSLFYFSLLISLCYALIVFTYCRSEIRRYSQNGTLAFLSCLIISVDFCATTVALNGALDTSPPQSHQGKVLGIYHLGKTPYVKVQDWFNPHGFVLIHSLDFFLRYFPIGSTATVLTKPGKFGYEYITGISKTK